MKHHHNKKKNKIKRIKKMTRNIKIKSNKMNS